MGLEGIAGATHVTSVSGISALSVLPAQCRRSSSQSGLVRGYYLCPHGSELYVFGGHPGLVQLLPGLVGRFECLSGGFVWTR